MTAYAEKKQARVDRNGRVRKHDPDSFWAKVNRRSTDECWSYLGPKNRLGYGAVTYQRRAWRAHRLAWTLTNGCIPGGLLVCHKCDNPPCCNPSHLFLGTSLDNTSDARRKGRMASGDRHPTRVHGTGHLPRGSAHHSKRTPWTVARGERNGSARLTELDVALIRRLYARGGCTHKSLASRFGVARSTITFILSGGTWRHVAK